MQENTQKNALIWLWVSAVIVLLDQASKLFVTHALLYNQPVTVLPVFNLTLQHNTGAAFSFLSKLGGVQVYILAGISVLAIVLILLWLRKIARNNWLQALGLCLVLGGALGNLIDRIRLQYVVDFLSFHWNEHYFATFNIADAAISVGATLIIIHMLFFSVKHD